MADDPLLEYLKRPTRRRFAALVRARRDLVLQAAFRVVGDTATAEDVAQEVFAKLLSSRPAPDDVRSPRGLLSVMTVNAARTRLRSRGRRAAHERSAAERRGEAEMGRDEVRIDDVRDAVEALAEPLRECVSLRYFGALSLEEVATEVGVSRRTVIGRLKDAREVLREKLEGPGYASVLAAVAGETDTGFPETPVRPEYLDRTDDLVRRADLPAGGPIAPLAWIGAVAVLGIALVAGLRGIGAFETGVAAAPAPPEVADVELAGRERGAPESDASLTRADNEGRSELVADSSGAGADEGVGFEVEVVDESGKLLRQGRLEIDLFGFPPRQILAALQPWRKLLDGVDLAEQNPVEVRDLPAVVDGLQLFLRATAPGRPPGDQRLLELDGRRVLSERFVLPPPRELRVAVRDRVTGRPVEAARVISLTELDRRELEPEDPGIGPGRSVTDAAGKAVITDLGRGPHEVAVHAEGYRDLVLEKVEFGPESRIELEPIGPVGGVRVTVTGPTGAPAKGMTVRLSLAGSGVPRVAESDAKGRVEFARVPVGHHHVKLDFDDWFRVLRDSGGEVPEDLAMIRFVDVERDGVVETHLGCLKGAGLVTATVVGPDARARPGVEVTITGPTQRAALTNEHGAAVFRELPTGSYRASIAHEAGGWDWSLTGEHELADGARLDLRLVAGTAVIRGRVIFPAGVEPPGRYFVSILGPAFEMVRPRGDGSFELRGVPPGTYFLSVGIAEIASPRTTVTVDADGPKEVVTISLVRGGRLLIGFARADRARLLDAEVRILDAEDRELSVDRDESGEHDRVSHALFPGSYRVEALLPGGKKIETTVEITDGKDEVVTLTVE